MLYHVSPVKGLKTLKPSVSTHKKAYVYAIENRITGLLFGAKKDDFDFIINTDELGIPDVYECYPGAFQSVYQGKSCSIYQVEEEGFLRGMTSWSVELVCEREVAVAGEIEVEDLYERLLEEEKKGSLRMHRYEYTDEYRERIASHVVDRLIRFQVDLNRCLEGGDKRFSLYYREIIQGLQSITDGHLLQ